MIIRLRFAALKGVILLGILCLAWADRAQAETSGNRILIIHDGAAVLQPLTDYLREHGRLDITMVDQAHLPPEDWKEYRAVLGYVHNRLQETTERRIIDYTRAGGRFVALHHMISSGKARNRYFFDFLGIRLDKPGASRNPVLPGEGYGWYNADPIGVRVILVDLDPGQYIVSHDVRWSDQVLYKSSDRPTLDGNRPAIVVPKAEAYMNVKFTDGREKTVLIGMSYVDPRTGAIFQQDRIGWFKRSGAGVIIYLQPGHFIEEYRNANIDQMVLNAILWDGR